jgi:hypothetical protein
MLARRLPSTSWGDDLGILIGGIFPGEMTGVDQVELALGQMLMETVRECIPRWPSASAWTPTGAAR